MAGGDKIMLNFKQITIRHILNILVMVATWSISLWFDVNFGISTLLGVVGYGVSNVVIKYVQQFRFLKKWGLTHSEYKHIEMQLSEANTELRNINRCYTKIRSFSIFKQLLEMNRMAKRIINIVRKNPRKFYQAEQFFYAHIHSASELTEKYALLSTQPIKSADVHLTLQETRDTLESLNNVMQEDLQTVLASDIEELKMELDFAKLNTMPKEKLMHREEN